MKRRFVVLAAIALSSGIFAPPKLDAQTTVGLLGGLNLGTFGGTDLGYHDHRTSVNVGAFLDLPLSKRVGLHLGAGYSGKGAKTAPEGEVETRIGYVEIPALLRFKLNPGGRVGAHLILGPTLSFKASCEVEIHDPNWRSTVDCDEADLEVTAIDLGATGGIGVAVDLSGRLILVGESLYTFGLRTVGQSGDGAKNRVFSMSLGLAFPIG